MRLTFLTIISLLSLALSAQNIPNPILDNVADIGVLRYNGKYYLGGCRTDGNIYVSSDLVNWTKPVHAIHMDNLWSRGSGCGDNQIHSNDFVYLNGTINVYWSVNYWGRDLHAVHTVHSEAQDPMGPYNEPDKTTWLDNRIDPKLFVDDDGSLYLYMVRFTDGNTIWCRKMKNPREFDGHPIYIFSSQPDSWETMDNKVIEGPWVMKYRDTYYMMYNANHTGGTWGNYQLGVAQADSPTTFNTGNKYSYPVLGNNYTTLEHNNTDILRYYNGTYNPDFLYTCTKPADNWQSAAFDDSNWKSAPGCFASNEIKGSTVLRKLTDWNEPELYIRKHFNASGNEGNLALRVTNMGYTRIALNGTVIYETDKPDYRVINLDAAQRKALLKGENLLTVETRSARLNNYFDVALLNLANETADDIHLTPGQPNILRGPNGFEWWLIYMANSNIHRRDQYIDRVHFFDRTLYVDGITGPNTKGYHPSPSAPTFGAVEATSAAGPFNAQAAKAYIAESWVTTNDNAGIIAWWADDANNARVGIDAASAKWYLATVVNGEAKSQCFDLPNGFRFGVSHNIRVERDGSTLKVMLDEIPAPGQHIFTDAIPATAGVAGTFANSDASKFEGTIYTIGFDDRSITLAPDSKTIDGEPLTGYELSFQLYGFAPDRMASCFPVYIDDKNNIKVTFNGSTRMLEVETTVKGKVKASQQLPLSRRRTIYPDVKYTDMVEKGYRFNTKLWIDNIVLDRHDISDNGRFTDNMFNFFNVERLGSDGRYNAIDASAAATDTNPRYSILATNGIEAEGLRFINKEGADTQRHIYTIDIDEALCATYNLRCVRDGNSLHLFVDGKQLASIDLANMPASQIAFGSANYHAPLKGILYYHKGISNN